MGGWDHTKCSPSVFTFAKAPKSRCCVCNKSVFLQKARGNRKDPHKQKQGIRIKASKLYPIYKEHRVVIGSNQSICDDCDALDVKQLVFKAPREQTSVDVPTFLKNILKGHDTLTQHAAEQKEAETQRKRRRSSDAPLYYKSLSDASIKTELGQKIAVWR